jgi:hypothetical protein
MTLLDELVHQHRGDRFRRGIQADRRVVGAQQAGIAAVADLRVADAAANHDLTLAAQASA